MIYLDNAATSYPKPARVLRKTEAIIRCGLGNPGRGSHSLSRASADIVYEARENTAAFFGSEKPENVVFTYNDTYAINMTLFGLLVSGDHVLISDMEHNSVYRPIAALEKSGRIKFDIFDTMCLSENRSADAICAGIEKLIKPETRLLVCAHTSNICSATLPIKEIGALCRRKDIIFMVDAAQSAGHIPINMNEMNIDILCAPAHKGLYGMMGCGFFIFGDRVNLRPTLFGGSGLHSLSPDMPLESPERFEAGTVGVPAVASLSEGIKFVSSVGISEIAGHETRLYRRFLSMLSELKNVKIYAGEHVGSTLLLNVADVPSERVARLLDENGICVRSGFHCAPLAHSVLGTGENGAVRFSFGILNREKELEKCYFALKNLR